jgi:hypothetical protein
VRRVWLAALGASLLAAGALVFVFVFSSGPSQPGVALIPGVRDPVQAAERTLSLELRSEQLSIRWVACIKNGRAYRGHPVIRCNVNFGDPHVVAYCSVIVAGRLVTSHQDPSIPCGPDLAGSKPVLFPASG